MLVQAFGRRDEIPPSSHVCQLYSRLDEVSQLAVALFTASSPPSNDRCLFVGQPAVVSQVELGLRDKNVEVDEMTKSGQLLLCDDRSEFLAQGRFDPFHLLSSHLSMINRAQRDGLQGLRVAIDMTWLAENAASPASILKYEAICDAVFTFQHQPIVAIGQYNAQRLGEQIVGEMMKLHPIAYVGRFLRRNPNYANSEQYFLSILRHTRNRSDREDSRASS